MPIPHFLLRRGRVVATLLFSAINLPIASAQSTVAKPAPVTPLPSSVPAPEDNPQTAAKIALGRQLFFDPRLSGDNRMSCATCHLPDKAWGDGLPTAKGHLGKTLARNTPSVLNVAFQPRLLWEGRAKSLEEQALLPITSPEEMHQDLAELVRELNAVPGYARQFQEIFGTPSTKEAIAKSLAAFERTLVTRPAPLDRYLAGDKQALSDAALRGRELFFGDAGCVRCHNGPLLSDGQAYRLGIGSTDQGLAAVTGKAEDRGKFRTPTLRNIAQTGPYMHNGSLQSLEDVVTFYYRGVGTSPEELPLDVQPLLGQSYSEIPDVVAFLEALSGETPKIEAPPLP